MDEQRVKLLEQMKILKLPLSDEDAKKNVTEMSDAEVSELVSFYTDVIDYENDVEDFVKEHAPEEYKRLREERDEKIKKKESDANYELERLQEEKDLKLDAEDAKEEREIEEVVSDIENDTEQIEDFQNDLVNTLKNGVSGTTQDDPAGVKSTS